MITKVLTENQNSVSRRKTCSKYWCFRKGRANKVQ